MIAVLFVVLAAITIPTPLNGQADGGQPTFELDQQTPLPQADIPVTVKGNTITTQKYPGGEWTGTRQIAQVTGEEDPDPPNDDPAPTDDKAPPNTFALVWAWITQNSAEAVLALLAILKIITNLTPTQKDNKWYEIIERFFNSIFPNLRSRSVGGGTHA